MFGRKKNVLKRITDRNVRSGLTDLELYEFDLNGFVVLKNYLSQAEVDQMNAKIDEKQNGEFNVKFQFFDLDQIFLDILSAPRMMGIANHLLGDWFRLDSAWGVQEVPPYCGQAGVYGLHAGPFANQNAFQYRWFDGKPFVTQLNCCYALSPVYEGDGGLVVVPGSHKHNMPHDGSKVWNELIDRDFDVPWIHHPLLEAGDLLIFAEATMHGTRPWIPTDRARRNLYYKYCPSHINWRKWSEQEKFASLARNELERRLLSAPYVGGWDDDELPSWQNQWRTPTLADL